MERKSAGECFLLGVIFILLSMATNPPFLLVSNLIRCILHQPGVSDLATGKAKTQGSEKRLLQTIIYMIVPDAPGPFTMLNKVEQTEQTAPASKSLQSQCRATLGRR